MVDFTINDYIWYIVGGIALLFILIGFIADKTGLAKKTFSRENQPIKGKEKNISASEIMSPNTHEEVSNLVASSEPISEESSLATNLDLGNSYEEVSESNLEESDSLSNDSKQDTLYLNEEETSNDESINDLEKAYLEGEESTIEIGDNSETFSGKEISPIAAEDAESEWGISSADVGEESETSENIELPNLEDLSTDAEEDVWKF